MTASASMPLIYYTSSSVSTVLTGLDHHRGLAWDSLLHKRWRSASVDVLLPRVCRAGAVLSVSGCLWHSVLFGFLALHGIKKFSSNPFTAMYSIYLLPSPREILR